MKVIRFFTLIAAFLYGVAFLTTCDLVLEGSADLSLSVNISQPSGSKVLSEGGDVAISKVLFPDAKWGEITLEKGGYRDTAKGALYDDRPNTFTFRGVELGRYTISVSAYAKQGDKDPIYAKTIVQILVSGKNKVPINLLPAEFIDLVDGDNLITFKPQVSTSLRYRLKNKADAVIIKDLPIVSALIEKSYQLSTGLKVYPSKEDEHLSEYYYTVIDKNATDGTLIITVYSTEKSSREVSININEVPRAYYSCTLLVNPPLAGTLNRSSFAAIFGARYDLVASRASFSAWTVSPTGAAEMGPSSFSSWFELSADVTITANYKL